MLPFMSGCQASLFLPAHTLAVLAQASGACIHLIHVYAIQNCPALTTHTLETSTSIFHAAFLCHSLCLISLSDLCAGLAHHCSSLAVHALCLKLSPGLCAAPRTFLSICRSDTPTLCTSAAMDCALHCSKGHTHSALSVQTRQCTKITALFWTALNWLVP